MIDTKSTNVAARDQIILVMQQEWIHCGPKRDCRGSARHRTYPGLALQVELTVTSSSPEWARRLGYTEEGARQVCRVRARTEGAPGDVPPDMLPGPGSPTGSGDRALQVPCDNPPIRGLEPKEHHRPSRWFWDTPGALVRDLRSEAASRLSACQAGVRESSHCVWPDLLHRQAHRLLQVAIGAGRSREAGQAVDFR